MPIILKMLFCSKFGYSELFFHFSWISLIFFFQNLVLSFILKRKFHYINEVFAISQNDKPLAKPLLCVLLFLRSSPIIYCMLIFNYSNEVYLSTLSHFSFLPFFFVSLSCFLRYLSVFFAVNFARVEEKEKWLYSSTENRETARSK